MKWLSTFLVASGLVSLCACAAAAQHETPGARQAEVARKGATVMPFDLKRTTHFFADDAQGGVETVTANRADDPEQVRLIRAHLAREAERFGRGDFSDPARIHGARMPGLAALERAGGKLHVKYEEVPGRARLVYASGDGAVVEAVHAWFAAQRADHAAHGHMHMDMPMAR